MKTLSQNLRLLIPVLTLISTVAMAQTVETTPGTAAGPGFGVNDATANPAMGTTNGTPGMPSAFGTPSSPVGVGGGFGTVPGAIPTNNLNNPSAGVDTTNTYGTVPSPGFESGLGGTNTDVGTGVGTGLGTGTSGTMGGFGGTSGSSTGSSSGSSGSGSSTGP